MHINCSCQINFGGNAGAIESAGTLQMFKTSMCDNIHHTRLIVDGDFKTHFVC